MDVANFGLAIAGLIVSLSGFTVAVIQIRRTRSAAERAEEAAKAARNSIYQVMSVVDLTQASSQIDQIKELHANEEWGRSLDRYTPLRQSLIAARSRLSEDSRAVFDEAIRQLVIMERTVRKLISEHGELSNLDFSEIMLDMQNSLDEVRFDLERAIGESD